jgi:hypothetical protein
MVPFTMAAYGELCAWTLARAHARSGDRLALAAYLGTDHQFEESLADFADAYAERNLLDFRHFRDVTGTAATAATA